MFYYISDIHTEQMSAVIDGERANGYDVIRKTTEGTS